MSVQEFMFRSRGGLNKSIQFIQREELRQRLWKAKE